MQHYESYAQEYRARILKLCAECLGTAINNKNLYNKDPNNNVAHLPVAIQQLAVALHIAADDCAHRQNNATLSAHASMDGVKDGVKPGTGTFKDKTPAVDNIYNPNNAKRYGYAKAVAEEIGLLYVNGNANTTQKELRASLNRYFPTVFYREENNGRDVYISIGPAPSYTDELDRLLDGLDKNRRK